MSGAFAGIVVGWCIGATALAAYSTFVLARVYRYAVRHADRLPLGSPGECAYSDIATVIALDGVCKDRIPEPSGEPE